MKLLSVVLLLLSPAIASAEQAAGQPSIWNSVFFLVAFIFLFYFMLIRPQSKKQKEHQNLVSGISTGDEVITSGGILGKVVKVSEQFIVIAVADNLDITIQRQAISASLPKGTISNI